MAALEAVRAGTPLLRANNQFGGPRRTLRHHKYGKVSIPGVVRLGHHRAVLTPEVEREPHTRVQYMVKKPSMA